MRTRPLPLLLLLLGLVQPEVQAATSIIPTESAFATSGWGVPAAPYRRDVWSGSVLGISNADPYQMGEYMASPEGGGQQWQYELKSWEETTYLVFDKGSFGSASYVQSAILSVTTTGRAGAPAGIGDGMSIAAHALSDDPTKILYTSADPNAGVYNPASPSYDPSLDYSNNYGTFKLDHLGAIMGTVAHDSGFGLYDIDLTSMVNGWLADPDAEGAFALALTGRAEGNSPDAWLAIFAGNQVDAPFLTITTIPEPGAMTLASLVTVLVVGFRRRPR
ncbi:hypothetical protein OKA04_22625 [Luteolibacter flavescens]|uniref:PEP-CTERM sorting domain-containing protein n=1 Tax=Luteolibacter flavescens TaxID=1859460 RepID=A0ABT3FW53_9BACT|nr:hypothetical protein [Luteolibacter flavescens]MCW1887549.1 hypothetical protein [Luteolibacter flavescens]